MLVVLPQFIGVLLLNSKHHFYSVEQERGEVTFVPDSLAT